MLRCACRIFISSRRLLRHQYVLLICPVHGCLMSGTVFRHQDRTFMARSICMLIRHRHQYWHRRRHRRHGNRHIFHRSCLWWTSLQCMSVMLTLVFHFCHASDAVELCRMQCCYYVPSACLSICLPHCNTFVLCWNKWLYIANIYIPDVKGLLKIKSCWSNALTNICKLFIHLQMDADTTLCVTADEDGQTLIRD